MLAREQFRVNQTPRRGYQCAGLLGNARQNYRVLTILMTEAPRTGVEPVSPGRGPGVLLVKRTEHTVQRDWIAGFNCA